MDRQLFEALEYDLMLGIISLSADSLPGRSSVKSIRPLGKVEDLHKRFDLILDIQNFLSLYPGFGLSQVGALDVILQKKAISGAVLEIEEIIQIRNNLLTAEDVRFKLSDSGFDYKELDKLVDAIPNTGSLKKAIDRVLDESGQVKDDASYELWEIRQAISSVRNRVNKVLEEHLKGEKYQNAIQDDIITKRSGRFVLMLKSDFKGVMEGIIHDSSHSGQSVFMEPMEVVELNNRLAKLEQEERLEIRRILLELSSVILEKNKELQETTRILVELDLLQALARLALKDGCSIPDIGVEDEIILENARHPLLDERISAARDEYLERKTPTAHKVVPISITLDGKKRGMVISGPNMGGKTVSLKTLGLLSLLALSGIPVPAEKFKLPFLVQVSADIGDQQEITQNISTFSSHLLNIKRSIDELQNPSLILLDELGTGTDPEEGSALARAIIDYFIEKGSFIVITTHSNYLKTYSCVAERLKSAAVQYDPATGSPTYRLIEGIPGSSKALGIAMSLGLSQEILDNAKGHLEAGHQYMEEYIDKLERERVRCEEETEKTLRLRRELEKEMEKTREERKSLEDQRRSFALRFKDEWSKILDKYSGEINKVIAALKDKTSQLQMKRLAAERIKDLEGRLRDEPLLSPLRQTEPVLELPDNLPEGTKVRLKKIRGECKLTRDWRKGTDKKIYLEAGGKSVEAFPDDVIEVITGQKVSTEGEKLYSAFSFERRGRIITEINLIGKASDEIEELVVKFLDDAMLAGLSEVRIVHGKGKGILKKTVAEILKRHPGVEAFSTAENIRGGEGATEVKLK